MSHMSWYIAVRRAVSSASAGRLAPRADAPFFVAEAAALVPAAFDPRPLDARAEDLEEREAGGVIAGGRLPPAGGSSRPAGDAATPICRIAGMAIAPQYHEI